MYGSLVYSFLSLWTTILLLEFQCLYIYRETFPDAKESRMIEIQNLQSELLPGPWTCGDGICNTQLGESCRSCSLDCGNCFFKGIITGCQKKSHVTLTFDDGPSAHTSALLATLKKENVQATFFVNGINIDSNPMTMSSLIRQAYRDGHVIGTHTYSHVGLASGTSGFNEASDNGYLELEELQMEMLMNDMVLSDALGSTFYPRAFRPPYLEMNATVLALLETMGYIPISINVDSNDWRVESTQEANTFGRRNSAPTKVQQILKNIKQETQELGWSEEGMIVLQHDTYASVCIPPSSFFKNPSKMP